MSLFHHSIVGSGRGRRFDCTLLVLSFQALLCKVVQFTNTRNCDHNWYKPAERMPSSVASGGLGLT